MSLQRVPAITLPGHSVGPVYPPTLGSLVVAFTAMDAHGMSEEGLDAAARACPSFAAMYQRATTSDHYLWRRAVMFSSGVTILIPWSTDEACTDGSFLDRSPAVYVRYAGAATAPIVGAAAAGLARAMEAVNRG